MAKPTAGRSASRSTPRVRCWWRTMSATSCGAWRRPRSANLNCRRRALYAALGARNPGGREAVGQPLHECRTEGPGRTGHRDGEVGILAHEGLGAALRLCARTGMEGAGDHDALAPERGGEGFDAASCPHRCALVAAGREVRTSHADESGVAQRV